MSAGKGVMHSEFNHAEGQSTHFFQIWIEPNVMGIEPSYEQKTVPAATKRGTLKVVASPQGEGDAVQISADATLYAGLLDGSEQADLTLNPARKAYVHLILVFCAQTIPCCVRKKEKETCKQWKNYLQLNGILGEVQKLIMMCM
jgi:redox-sensitive bicupin YhaK (pirin superfamily)